MTDGRLTRAQSYPRSELRSAQPRACLYKELVKLLPWYPNNVPSHPVCTVCSVCSIHYPCPGTDCDMATRGCTIPRLEAADRSEGERTTCPTWAPSSHLHARESGRAPRARVPRAPSLLGPSPISRVSHGPQADLLCRAWRDAKIDAKGEGIGAIGRGTGRLICFPLSP